MVYFSVRSCGGGGFLNSTLQQKKAVHIIGLFHLKGCTEREMNPDATTILLSKCGTLQVKDSLSLP